MTFYDILFSALNGWSSKLTHYGNLFASFIGGIASFIARVLKIKGNTVVWNQQVDTSTSSVTLTSGHKFVTKVNGTYSVVSGTGQSLAVTGGTDEVFDITKMLGSTLADSIYSMEQNQAGSGVAYFRKLFPLDYYSYESGKLLNFNGVSIQTENADQTESSIKQLPISTYFPTGMKSAGSVYDELTPSKAVKRVGSVDLGTLNWSYSSGDAFFYASLADIKRPSNWAAVGNYITAIYTTVSGNDLSVQSADMVLSGNPNNSQVRVKNSNYTDAQVFKTAMSGVYLNYELAQEVETAITENLNYTVYSGGTEELLPIDDISTSPFSANIDYPSGNEDVYFTIKESGIYE